MRLIFLILLLTINNLFAKPDSLKAVQLLEKSLVNIKTGNIDSIDHNVEISLTIFEQQNDLYNWLKWYKKIGLKWQNVKNYNKALEYFHDAKQKIWRKTENDRELQQVAYIYFHTGNVYRKINDLESAIKHFENHRTICEESLKKSPIYLAQYVYNRLGNIYSSFRDGAKSDYYFDEVKRISEKESDWRLYVKACRNQGGAYKGLEEYELAEEAYMEGLKWVDSLSFYGKMDLYIDLGLNYCHLENYKDARKFTELAKELFDEYSENLSAEDKADYQYSFFYNYGRINKGEKKIKLAESYYQKALILLEESLKEGNRRQMAIMHFNFGELYLDQQQYPKAEKYFQNAITYLSPILSEYKDPRLVPVNYLNGEFLLGYAYQKLGNIAVDRYKQDRKTVNLHKAIRYYELADLVDQLRIQNYTAEESILTALAGQRDLKEEMQFALFELYQRDSQDSIKEKMLAFSEKSRAFLLLEKDKRSKDILKWDEGSRKSYYIKQAKRQTLEEAIYALGAPDTEDEIEEFNRLKRNWLKANEELADLQQQKNKDSKFKFSPPASLNSIRQTLDVNQGLIEFFIGKSHIYTYAISTQGFEVYQKLRTEALVSSIEQLRNTLICDFDAIEMFGGNASYLFETLLKEPLGEFPDVIDRLVLVPDHLLNYIPFEILLTSSFLKEMHHYNMPYLIRKYSISSANSATLYALQQQTKQIHTEQLFAGYAPKFKADYAPKQDTCEIQLLAMSNREGYSELKGARKEVNKIAAALGGDSIIGNAAVKAHFKANAANYRILLLSTHGLVNSETPHFSQLLFAPGTSSDDKTDDVLTALELYNMNLNAELVVLSACNTGYGKQYPGEGVFSFSRAFFAAGVPSTVMTLWSVNDQSTSELMISFFDYLKKGMSKDRALQLAKLDYLTNNKNDKPGLHPYYWSGVLVCGNTNSLSLENDFFRDYILLFFILFSIFALLFFFKKSN